MAWAGPSSNKPVWCAATGSQGPTAERVTCTTTDPGTAQNPQLAQAEGPRPLDQSKPGSVSDVPAITMPLNYQRFTSQIELGHYLIQQYNIRSANELSSCETCHR